MNKILRIWDVMELTGLSRSSLYQMIQIGDFPRPIELGKRCVGWVASEVEDWIQERIAKSRNQEGRV